MPPPPSRRNASWFSEGVSYLWQRVPDSVHQVCVPGCPCSPWVPEHGYVPTVCFAQPILTWLRGSLISWSPWQSAPTWFTKGTAELYFLVKLGSLWPAPLFSAPTNFFTKPTYHSALLRLPRATHSCQVMPPSWSIGLKLFAFTHKHSCSWLCPKYFGGEIQLNPTSEKGSTFSSTHF